MLCPVDLSCWLIAFLLTFVTSLGVWFCPDGVKLLAMRHFLRKVDPEPCHNRPGNPTPCFFLYRMTEVNVNVPVSFWQNDSSTLLTSFHLKLNNPAPVYLYVTHGNIYVAVNVKITGSKTELQFHVNKSVEDVIMADSEPEDVEMTDSTANN